MSVLSEDLVQALAVKCSVPVVLRGFVKEWSLCQWTIAKWCSIFGDKKIPFRCLRKDLVSDEPCWERRCKVISMTFKEFVDILPTTEDWMYFDYKYIHQWFEADNDFSKAVTWKEFGYPDKGASDTTLWVGSSGSHTPAHQDTYGVNIVAQVHGMKRWLLFPPETGGLRPTRVPYEESSVYSELNFYCPNNLDGFSGLSGGRMVELNAGDALLVPRGWWHYVQNMEPLNIAVNVWLPHESDTSTQVTEALVKIFIAQICKDLPQKTTKLLVNPNEDDISDTPLAVLFLQLETVANASLDSRRKTRRAKRQKTTDDVPSTTLEDYDLKSLLDNKENNLEIASSITSEEIVNLIKQNLERFASCQTIRDEDELDGDTSSIGLTKAVIDAFCRPDVMELVKQNLFAKLSNIT